MKFKSRKLFICRVFGVAFCSFLGLSISFCFAEEPLNLLTFKTHSRLILHVDSSVPIVWRTSVQGFEIKFTGLALDDLKSILGDLNPLRSFLKSLEDYRTGQMEVKEDSQGVKITGKWKYPKGKLALANPKMEVFEYREKTPAQFIADFWVKPGPTVVELKNQEHKEKLEALLQKMRLDEKKRHEQKIAIEKRRSELKNSSRFCSQPLTEKSEIFLKLYPLHKKIDFSRWFPTTTADTEFPYFKPEGTGKDAQYVRLAQQFYATGKTALAIRTLDFFDSEYPHSDFQNEMKFLRANALIKLGYSDASEKILKSLMAENKKAPVALHAAMFTAAKLVKKESYVVALESFLWLIENYSEHRLNWVFHLGAAECLYQLKQNERASQEYHWVIEKGPNSEAKSEGLFRLGDLYLQQFRYEQALGAYYQGFGPYLKYKINYPEFYLNRGETLYQLGQNERAKEELEEFLKKFPGHPAGWRATFRIAEILGADPVNRGQESEKYREFLFATVDNYPKSTGAVLARIRLIPCHEHGGFDLTSQEKFFSTEANTFNGNGEVLMKDYPDFRALAHVRSLVTLGTSKQISEMAIQELTAAKSPLVRKILKTVANDFFQKMILELLQDGKTYEALSTYVAKAHTVPTPEDDTDVEYLLKLSEVASDLNFGELGHDLLEKYKKETKPKRSLASIGESNSGIYTDIESVLNGYERDFAAAKSLWIGILPFLKTNNIKVEEKESEKNIKKIADKDLDEKIAKIKGLLDHVKGESKFSFEKELILGLIDERDNDLKSALEHAASAKLMGKSIQLDAWHALLISKSNDSQVALNLLRKLEVRLKTEKSEKISEEEFTEQVLGIPVVVGIEPVSTLIIQILEKQGRWGEVATEYSNLLEYGLKSNRVLYGYARSLTKTKDPLKKKEALEALHRIESTDPKEESEIFWKKLAVETLANEETHKSVSNNAKEGKI